MSENPYPAGTAQHDLWQLRHDLSCAVGGRRGLLNLMIKATLICWALAFVLWLIEAIGG